MSIEVLIVDDSKFSRTLIKNSIPKNTFSIVGEASDGQDGFEAYQELSPDIVIMDMNMKYMNGVEAIEKIMDYDSEAIIIVCSALGTEHKVKEAINSGAIDFVVKPVDSANLSKALNKAKQKLILQRIRK
ncbi:response regulator [Fuchsiella alkaliacetigena]|uniref:response regulator n=1 Tax=Fuchsiella alkaliacetigena TaxID=957042 RepID=UPI00200B367E|nr:response regulator [Fuchsiella alkaliacetigena]MCK8825574.1 response regulator [Fuchsiella alkaliacetigena]